MGLTKSDVGNFQDTKSTRLPYEPSPNYSSPVSNYSSPVSSYSSSLSSSISSLSNSLSSSISSLSSSNSGLANTTIYQGGDGLNANGLPNNGDTSPYGQGFVGDPILTLGAGISAFTPINGQCPTGYQLLPHPQIAGAFVCTNVGGVRLQAVSNLLNQAQAQGYASVYQMQQAFVAAKRIWKAGLGLFSNVSLPPGTVPTKNPPVPGPSPTSPTSPTTPTNPKEPNAPGGTVTPSPVGLDDNLFDVISNLFPGGAGNLDLQGSPRDSEGLIFADYPAEISVPQSSSRSPVLIILVVLGLAGAGYWYYKNRM